MTVLTAYMTGGKLVSMLFNIDTLASTECPSVFYLNLKETCSQQIAIKDLDYKIRH